MTDGILQRFPDVTLLLRMRDDTQAQTGGLVGVAGALDSANADSPLATVVAALNELDARLDIDMSGLTTRLPAGLDTMRNALPPDTLEYIESIEGAYTAVQDFLDDTALVQAIPAGSSLTDTAMGVIQTTLNRFDERLNDLTDGLISAESLERVHSTFAALQRFQDDFPANQEQFLPFLSENLVGVAPDLLDAPLNYLQQASAVLAPLEPQALATTLQPARQALGTAISDLFTRITSFDPADSGAYAAIQHGLDTVETAMTALIALLDPLYRQMQELVDTHPWDSLFVPYRTLLDAIDLGNVPSLDDFLGSMTGLLEDLLARMLMIFDAEDLQARIGALSETLRDTFAGSALAQVRQTLQDFLGQIRDAIAGVPTEAVQEAVEAMLDRVGQELAALQIDQIVAQIDQAFQDAESFVTDTINTALTGNVRAAVGQLLSQVQDLPIDDLVTRLSGAIDQLGSLIAELGAALDAQIGQIQQLLADLETLSYRPVSDAVIVEIDDIKARLQEINPNALSDAEKLAIKGALAVLEAIDLEGQVIVGLKDGYHAAEEQVRQVLNELTAALERLRNQMGSLDPQSVLQPVCDQLDNVMQLLQHLNGRALLAPLYGQVEALAAHLETLAPGQLLDPLQAPYDRMLAVVQRIDPNQWAAPLAGLYARIDQLIDYVDVVPVLEELDRRQRALFASVRTTILEALDGLDLPEPLDGFFDAMRPVIEGLTDALFGDPDSELQRIALDMRTRFQLSSLFAPLDVMFDRLMAMLANVPRDDLTNTMNTLRLALGSGLDALDPRAISETLRAGQGRLADLAPASVLALPLRLPGMKLAFEARVAGAPAERAGDIAAVSARFDAVFALVDPADTASPVGELTRTHDQVHTALRQGINRLDLTDAAEAYGRLRRNLDHRLPNFLQRPQPLVYDEIIAGVAALRPSAQAERLDQLVERFLRQLQPMTDSLEAATNDLFAGIREMLLLINPLSLKDAVQEIYDTIREKVRILDPDDLAGSLRENLFAPLLEPLEALDPARLKARLDAAFTNVLDAVRSGVIIILDDITSAVEEQLALIRQAVQALLQQLKDVMALALEQLGDILDSVEQLVFVDLLERLQRVIDNLGMSFDKELDRVRSAFDAMLSAIPLSSSASAGVSV